MPLVSLDIRGTMRLEEAWKLVDVLDQQGWGTLSDAVRASMDTCTLSDDEYELLAALVATKAEQEDPFGPVG